MFAASNNGSSGVLVFYLIVIGCVYYFWVRPRRKKRRAQSSSASSRIRKSAPVRTSTPEKRPTARKPQRFIRIESLGIGVVDDAQAGWIPPGHPVVVQGLNINGGGFYLGHGLAGAGQYRGIEPALVDPRLPVDFESVDRLALDEHNLRLSWSTGVPTLSE